MKFQYDLYKVCTQVPVDEVEQYNYISAHRPDGGLVYLDLKKKLEREVLEIVPSVDSVFRLATSVARPMKPLSEYNTFLIYTPNYLRKKGIVDKII